MQSVLHKNGPNHLVLWLIGLSSQTMALITSGCDCAHQENHREMFDSAMFHHGKCPIGERTDGGTNADRAVKETQLRGVFEEIERAGGSGEDPLCRLGTIPSTIPSTIPILQRGHPTKGSQSEVHTHTHTLEASCLSCQKWLQPGLPGSRRSYDSAGT